MNNIVFKQLLISIFYAIVIAGLYLFANTQLTVIDCILFIVGTLLATGVLWADEQFFAKKYAEPNSNVTHLITRSLIFILVFIPLSVFVVTSSGSLIGVGLVLALGVNLFIEMWMYRNQIQVIHDRFLYQVKKTYNLVDIQRSILIFGLFVLLLHILVIR